MLNPIDRRRFITLAAAGVGLAALPAPAVGHAAQPATTTTPGAWGDQRDGTYVNPVLPTDVSDIDAIRVGDDYFAITSTMQFSPGMAVLHSRDMVNWETIGHCIDDVTQIGPELNWNRMNRFGRGVWAPGLRHHDGRFWMYVGAPDEGMFMTTATDPAGPWEPLTRLWSEPGWNDPCPFWDDDGQGYLATTNFSRNYAIHLFTLAPDGRSITNPSLTDPATIVQQSRGSEASKLYKIDGRYYHFYSEVRSEGRVCMMNRSDVLFGPKETRQLNHVNPRVDREPNQGGLLQAADGSWHFFTHQGTGGNWEGRPACLLPVTWIDGWPVIGEPGSDGIGTMVFTGAVPVGGRRGAPLPALPPLVTDDEFDAPRLRPQWEWNYQPRPEKWSLTERPGFLRLHAFPPLAAHNLARTGNVLTQRSFRSTASSVTTRMELDGLVDGQHAGLCHFAATYAGLGVARAGGATTISHNRGGVLTAGPVVDGPSVWLRSSWDLAGVSRFAYSLDGAVFTEFGDTYQLTWGGYRGDHVGLYTYNPGGDAGHVDVDRFGYSTAPARPYAIRSVRSGKALAVAGTDRVVQSATAGRWAFRSIGEGHHVVVEVATGRLLGVGSGDAVVVSAGLTGTPAQQWRLDPIGPDGAFTVVNRGSGRVLDVRAGSSAEGTPVIAWNGSGSTNQQWTFVAQP